MPRSGRTVKLIFAPTALPGVVMLELEPAADERGFFARTFCDREFAAHGLPTEFIQHSISFNHRAGTLRGLHFQASPSQEAKLVRCLRGAVYDVIVDIRRDQPTFRQWCALELTAERRSAVFIPKGFAHGFQTLRDNSELLYMIDAVFRPEAATGILWNDPALGIPWPLSDPILSERDRALPCLS